MNGESPAKQLENALKRAKAGVNTPALFKAKTAAKASSEEDFKTPRPAEKRSKRNKKKKLSKHTQKPIDISMLPIVTGPTANKPLGACPPEGYCFAFPCLVKTSPRAFRTKEGMDEEDSEIQFFAYQLVMNGRRHPSTSYIPMESLNSGANVMSTAQTIPRSLTPTTASQVVLASHSNPKAMMKMKMEKRSEQECAIEASAPVIQDIDVEVDFNSPSFANLRRRIPSRKVNVKSPSNANKTNAKASPAVPTKRKMRNASESPFASPAVVDKARGKGKSKAKAKDKIKGGKAKKTTKREAKSTQAVSKNSRKGQKNVKVTKAKDSKVKERGKNQNGAGTDPRHQLKSLMKDGALQLDFKTVSAMQSNGLLPEGALTDSLMKAITASAAPKRKRGRPKGSLNKKKDPKVKAVKRKRGRPMGEFMLDFLP